MYGTFHLERRIKLWSREITKGFQINKKMDTVKLVAL